MKKKSIEDIDVKGKRIFLRTDYNVPIEDGIIKDYFRIKSTFPTLEYLINDGAESIIIGTHLGRPKGQIVEDMSVKNVYDYLRNWFKEKNLNLEFKNFYDEEILKCKYIILENLRFLPEEEDLSHHNSEKYTDFLKKIADVCVIDAFGVVHHECASTTRTGLPTVAGLLLKSELNIANLISKKSSSEKRPIDLFITGGKKVEGKINFLKNQIKMSNMILIVGGMCNPFLKKCGYEIGKSYFDANFNNEIDEIYDLAVNNSTVILLPVDFVAKKYNDPSKYEEKDILLPDDVQVDIGNKTINMLKKCVSDINTIFWNGPPGVYENPCSENGTKRMVEILEEISLQGKKVIVGGGETVSAVSKYGKCENFYYVSTGGGSLISLLGGDDLPGIKNIHNIEDK